MRQSAKLEKKSPVFRKRGKLQPSGYLTKHAKANLLDLTFVTDCYILFVCRVLISLEKPICNEYAYILGAKVWLPNLNSA